jgi:hypothetical protein
MYKQFLADLWDTKGDGYILLWCYDGDKLKESHWFTTSEAAATFLDRVAARRVNFYVGVGLSPKDYGLNARCLKKDITGIAGMFLDIDIQSPEHKKKNLPSTIEEAKTLLTAIELQPTYIIHSGHGLQAWWLFREVWTFDSATERADAEQLEKRFIYFFKAAAKQRGWDVDSVFNLDRVLRVPGTTNYKGTPVPVDVLERNEVRWNPSDFEEILPEIAKDTTQAQTVKDDLQLNASADPPFDKFQLLVEVEPRFKQSWDRDRKDFQDQSASTYDMSLARFASNAGWSDQEITNLLIASRRKHGDELKLRQDYYQRTIACARRSAEQQDALNEIELYVDAQEPGETAAIDPNEKEAKLQSLSSLFGVTIVQIIKFIADPPEYKLKTVRGDITLGGVENLIGQGALRVKIAAATGKYLPKFKPAKWDKIAQVLLDCCYEVPIGDEATEAGEVSDWLEQYLASKPPMDNDDMTDALLHQLPVKYKGRTAIFGADFRKWLRTTQQEKVTAKRMGLLMRGIGCEPSKLTAEIGGKTTSRSVWFVKEA